MNTTSHPSRAVAPVWLVLAAFATVYLVWGSTYLAIRYVVETIPPFGAAAARFLIAGVVLFALTYRRTRLTRANWLSAALVGTLLLLGGNGLVCWAQQTVPSGVAAVIVATAPLWFVLLDWLLLSGPRPSWIVGVGLLLGLLGVWLLVRPTGESATRINPAGAVALLLACVSWSFGSVLSRRLPMPPGALLSTSMQMLCGGVSLLVVSLAMGEWGRLDVSAISIRSLLALGYLVVFGAILAFSAYNWLLQVSTPARVATYAYVNPAVAVLLGWGIAGEELSPGILMATGMIVAAVLLITVWGRPAPRPKIAPATPVRLQGVEVSGGGSGSSITS